MTVPELMANVLDKIRRDFYDGNTPSPRDHAFNRDRRALMRAIATYGHECNNRGWNFDVEFIYMQLMKLLLDIRTADAEIKYLPVYLEGAIKRHIGQRAEALSAKAKAIENIIDRVKSKLPPATTPPAAREPSPVEVLSQVYRGIKIIQRQRRAAKGPRATTPQKDLI